MPEKNHTLALKIIGFERKCHLFSFFVARNRNLISDVRRGLAYLTNKNITSSVITVFRLTGFSFRFFRHFGSPVTSKTTLSAHQTISYLIQKSV